MKNPPLISAILKTVARLDPVPVRVETLQAELDLALADPVTTVSFESALSHLRRRDYVAVGDDPLLGCRTVALTDKGRREAERL